MGKLFCCYSADLKDFLYKHGFRYEVCGLNPNNHQMFWAYIRTSDLSNALDKWPVSKKKE